MHSLFPFDLYLVLSSDGCAGRDFLQVAEQAIRGGVDVIQIREKDLPFNEYVYRSLKLKSVTDRYNVPLIINDDVEVMLATNAYGIHVGNSDASPIDIRKDHEDAFVIGYSIEHLDQVQSGKALVSDYIAASPVFNTGTKTNTIIEWGLDGVAAIRRLSDKPLVAIGSMNRSNAGDVIRAGADCISVVSAICASDDPWEAALTIKKEITHAKKI
ncbi:thiamine phosphate synthase [Terrimonas sp. NA20]|uniref:Thiamine-phosphate synthase n=1 Tax=Terrimonas ginsenosidimutans TaxID=2908004 RepID=A0ABS9KTS6_9BACT|nr:thiamine phosphate synthase [Terrimonas ginsenosidimutans]MCG2615736.1 thiamine phosphate synthase [Terrimonas ginsenosidimutans]